MNPFATATELLADLRAGKDLTPIRFTGLLARETGGFVKPEGYE
jgi:hypothetical protein